MQHAILGARSSFSVGESILPVEKLVAQAKDAGAATVFLTDTMSVTGLIDFTNKAKKAGIKPVIGCRLRFVDDVSWRKVKGAKAPPEFYLNWYVLSERGMVALFRLLSLANSEDRYYTTPKLAFDDLFDALDTLSADDVAIASGEAYSVIAHAQASDYLERIKGILGASNTFLTLVPINTPYWDTMNLKASRLAKALELPTIVSRPVSYARNDADAGDVMNAIATNTPLDAIWAKSPVDRDRHAMPFPELLEEVKAAIKRLHARGEPDAIRLFQAGVKAISRLGEMATYEWKKSAPSLPKMAPDEYLAVVQQCQVGWKKRFAATVFAHKPTPEALKDVYLPRLKYELSVLQKLSFSGYFLLVQDVVQFAKSQGILVGPGRGSVGGSLVAYLMGITECDPIRFDLLFERFINPDRIDLPDADLDFMSTRRHEIFDYLRTKYGREKFAFVSNFNDLKSKSAIRDVSKAFGLSEEEFSCSKLAPAEHGVPVSLAKAASLVPEIAEFGRRNKEIWDICLSLENVTRTFGQHAAGVVVSDCDVVERAVVEKRKEGYVVCWDKRMVEDQGLIKMDILGLQTLDLIDLALKFIRNRHLSKRVDLMDIPLDDPSVLTNFAAGLTTAVFQFESGGMRRLLRDLGKSGEISFDDITAATALYRPGPMDSGMMESFWKRKQGLEAIEQLHPLMEPFTRETYGVLTYQEQVMQAARTLAGYTAGEADKLRKIMGKKEPEEMKKQRDKFVDGCMATVGMSGGSAGDLFDKIEKFAGYGFNKAHSCEYTLISYQSMWLKTYFPVEFVAAALTILPEEKLLGILVDAKRLGIDVVLPDINLSTGTFEILNDVTLCIPFNKIKGISDNTTQAILAARAGGPFTSIEDLSKRVERRKCNIGHIKKLDEVGAFARIEPGQQPANHPDRIKIQKDLIPGLIIDAVPIDRVMDVGDDTMMKTGRLMNRIRAENKDDGMIVKSAYGSEGKFMVVMDAATNGEEQQGQFTWGRGFAYVQDSLSALGWGRSDAYWTGVLKRPKSERQITAAEFKRYAPYLHEEIAIMKPSVILALGATAVRFFIPDFKGRTDEQAGRVYYIEAIDANVVIGFNPGQIHHDRDKQDVLNDCFNVVAKLLP